MTTFLSSEVRAGLELARKTALERSSRLRVHAGEAIVPVLQFEANRFGVDAEAAPKLRGLVDIYDGARHLYQALIVTSTEEDGLRVYEFKRNTMASSGPALDFVRDEDAPSGLLPSH
ncbi:MAG: hypothetical protein AAF700_11605 [Pseudomonadota bacterium]